MDSPISLKKKKTKERNMPVCHSSIIKVAAPMGQDPCPPLSS